MIDWVIVKRQGYVSERRGREDVGERVCRGRVGAGGSDEGATRKGRGSGEEAEREE